MSLTTIRHSGVPENTHSAASTAATAAWRVGEKPHDPLDPGPYGTPGWQPDPRRGRRRRGELPDPLPEAPADFSPLREAAYRDFLRDSEELHLAHLEPPQPNRVLVYLTWYLRVVIAVLYWRVIPFPERPSRCRQARAVCEARQATRYVGRAAVVPPPIPVEWRTVSRPAAARPAVRPGDRARTRPQLRPHAVMAPRNRALSRRRAETRAIFHQVYGFTCDQNFRNVYWPKGSAGGYTATYPSNPRRGAIRRRNNRRPRNLALARSFPPSTPVVPVGMTSRPAPVGPTVRLLPVPAPELPNEAFARQLRDSAIRSAIRASNRRSAAAASPPSRSGTGYAPSRPRGGTSYATPHPQGDRR
ncbi:hypothetical protein [Glycomyces sp. NPDC048151]|uniref:hypothetical protein n=1 Tax=Glycomyces sp. NPDC048151 TaxID=3364002 RepID=UPI0037110C18